MEFVHGALILAGMFLFVVYAKQYQREEDLIHQLETVIRELRECVYQSELGEYGKTLEITLSDDTSRMTYRRMETTEHLAFSLFFRDAEKSGANTTIIIREKTGYGYRVRFTRNNTLCGRVLYHITGRSFRKNVHRALTDTIQLMESHARGTMNHP